MKTKWRRWRPRQNRTVQHNTTITESWDIFESAERRIKNLSLGRRFKQHSAHTLQVLKDNIKQAREHVETLEHSQAPRLNRAEAWLWLLVLQAPQAAEAQQQMDKHPHGYHDKNARLFELIDFNDAFVSTVLACPHDLLPHLSLETRRLMNAMCKKAKTRSFSDEQFEAITHGLSREIAVYLGVKKEGFEAEMTNRATDAFGIDMRIIEPLSMRRINVDVKARSAFHYRIHDLEREGRLSEEELIMADRNGFTAVYNGRDEQRTKVVLWRIDHEVLGDIVDFEFKNTKALGEMLRKIMQYVGEKI